MMSADEELITDSADENKLVRPKLEFQSLLQLAGATKDVFTMKEVMFYLGQYIIQKQLYDHKQQHIVHCSQDALGRLLGVDSFSVKEPRALFAMITKNLETVKSQESPPSVSEEHSTSQTEEVESESHSSSPDRRRSRQRRRRRRRRSCRSSDPGPSHSLENNEEEEESEEEEEEDGRKRRRSDSYSLTFDDSLSWCVISGLGSGRDRHSSQSSDSHSTSTRSEVAVPLTAPDSDSDNFSVEFEVESVDSDDYNEDDASVSADDQVYEVTIFEENGDDDDSFDEDTEITEADYWQCVECEEFNPPLPRHCRFCWTLHEGWLPDESGNIVNSSPSCPKALPTKPNSQSATKEATGSDVEENDGVDVPDGKRAKTPLPLSQCLSDSTPSAPDSASSAPSSQDLLCSSQPSSSFDSQELLRSPRVPELERSSSAEWRLPESCLDPCLICQSRPKNGCIVHGRTGHLMSCYICARKLKKRNKLCPVCRLPIQSVVLTYLS
ncbi:E3 ubiquitin-protein ligase Mdm2 [Solea solea]|uniref:E3 ubiquitin-protein ligase Mdm2 n=1 Tax=Solea solea TaxID=90069 RepID=UPI0027296165|nr:E3 ubiquitin-protein ligase Mdm2 [Solea solea]XP_058480272.1 E3 ubiquitin-protein ligase Mdm2 [Solea solea]XP_058480273.1 E3 ubiquitin-protein ligase Mdm2 [Solea solea]XP_058480274.1 E3 ubiquitin-protein ligase Mdm2 [Solea solea]XP_058480275.1 E3 ubiquitin-protein ligase Mdm2 [Solea solea]XP_058480276.1 E3 ubiquitin-protein ligase Mdm2 [Solea solea]XP_058480278.1 E3 ubiquitin-protein ligase Mdm2 [Solea solea]